MTKNFPKLTIDNETKMRKHTRGKITTPQTNARKAYIQTAEKMKMKRKY